MRPITILLALAPALVSAEWAIGWWSNTKCNDGNDERLGYIGMKSEDISGSLDSEVRSARFTFTDGETGTMAIGDGNIDTVTNGECYIMDSDATKYWATGGMKIDTTWPNR